MTPFTQSAADLARPFALYVVSASVGIGFIVALALKVDLVSAATYFTPMGLLLGGMYGAKAAEEANKSKHQAQAAVGMAQAGQTTTVS